MVLDQSRPRMSMVVVVAPAVALALPVCAPHSTARRLRRLWMWTLQQQEVTPLQRYVGCRGLRCVRDVGRDVCVAAPVQLEEVVSARVAAALETQKQLYKVRYW